jgi:hypothetical protein
MPWRAATRREDTDGHERVDLSASRPAGATDRPRLQHLGSGVRPVPVAVWQRHLVPRSAAPLGPRGADVQRTACRIGWPADPRAAATRSGWVPRVATFRRSDRRGPTRGLRRAAPVRRGTRQRLRTLSSGPAKGESVRARDRGLPKIEKLWRGLPSSHPCAGQGSARRTGSTAGHGSAEFGTRFSGRQSRRNRARERGADLAGHRADLTHRP